MKWIKYDCNGDEQVWYSDDEVEKLKAENKQLQRITMRLMRAWNY